MKKIMISLGFAALALGANAQVKIKDGTAGSTTTVPSNAAILELESAQRGLLLPRVPLSSTTAATLPGGATPVAGLFVYNTATTGSGSTAVFPGIYYYNGNFWVRVIGSASSANDTIVDVNGNLGIGTSNPTQKLDIETGGTAAAPVTGFKLNDGTQGAGKTLTSDANGVGTWQPASIIGTVSGTSQTITLANYTSSFYTDPNTYINLPPGRWMVTYYLPVRYDQAQTTSDQLIFNFGFADPSNNLSVYSRDILYPHQALVWGRQLMQVLINNTSGVTQKYSLVVGNAALISAGDNSVNVFGSTTITLYPSGFGGNIFAYPVTN